jgi:hypothetical protein
MNLFPKTLRSMSLEILILRKGILLTGNRINAPLNFNMGCHSITLGSSCQCIGIANLHHYYNVGLLLIYD